MSSEYNHIEAAAVLSDMQFKKVRVDPRVYAPSKSEKVLKLDDSKYGMEYATDRESGRQTRTAAVNGFQKFFGQLLNMKRADGSDTPILPRSDCYSFYMYPAGLVRLPELGVAYILVLEESIILMNTDTRRWQCISAPKYVKINVRQCYNLAVWGPQAIFMTTATLDFPGKYEDVQEVECSVENVDVFDAGRTKETWDDIIHKQPKTLCDACAKDL